MNNKRLLLKKLLEYPNLNNNEYKNLINKKNNIINNDNYYDNDLIEIDNKINLYLEKNLIIDMIKSSPTSPSSLNESPSFFIF